MKCSFSVPCIKCRVYCRWK